MSRRNRAGLPATVLASILLGSLWSSFAAAEMKTWDGRHSIDEIAVTVVYFVPRDRTPLADWRERVDYYCRRISQFHAREYQGQSKLSTAVVEEPFRSARSVKQLRGGDANFIFFQTLREVDETLSFGQRDSAAFPILLVLSDINWRPLDDFYRLKPSDDGPVFEGNYNNGRHFPGAAAGGARATYLAAQRKGWGLVSADGWRVPCSGSDCVVYHEGVGHTVGLPHPEPGNGSVMSQGQYRGWISQSWLDDDQKRQMGWKPAEQPVARNDLYSVFHAWPDPPVPSPNEPVSLRCVWPGDVALSSCRVRIQTDLTGPWVDVPCEQSDSLPERIHLPAFDRATPVSYRIEAALTNGQDVELWGYFQVRSEAGAVPTPHADTVSIDLRNYKSAGVTAPRYADAVELLPLIRIPQDQVAGQWEFNQNGLMSPRGYGSRLEIPYQPPAEYQLTLVVEPLDEPNGLILGHRLETSRFLTLMNFVPAPNESFSAIENIDGRNFRDNPSVLNAPLFRQNRLSQVVCTIRRDSVSVSCDGRPVIDWQGSPDQLSLSDYWMTPHDNMLFIGTYDCRYRFHRITLLPITGEGVSLVGAAVSDDETQ